MRRLAVLAVLALLLAAPAAAAKGCSETAPCVIAVTAEPGRLAVEPAVLEGFGPYVLHISNVGNVSLNVSFAGLDIPVGPGNATRSVAFKFPAEEHVYTLSESAGNATATLDVRFADRGPGEWGKSATLLSVLLPCTVGIALIGIALLVLRNGAVHRHNLVFGAYYMLSGLKSFSEGIDGVADGFHEQAPLFPATGFWALLAAFCALMMLPTLLLFLASFPKPLEALQRRPALAVIVFVPSLLVATTLVSAVLGLVSVETQGVAEGAFNVYGTLLTVLVIVHILRATRSREPIERTQARYVAFGFAPAFVMGWLITALLLLPAYGVLTERDAAVVVADLIHFVSPVLELLSAGAVAFAILRYNILGVSPRFRVGVKSFLVGFIFVLVFLVTQFIENVVLQGQLFSFAGDYGSFILSGVSGVVLFKPIEVVSNKAANRLVPDRRADEAAQRAAEVYRAQCTYVLRDAQVSEREMAFLRNLRAQLGLSEAVARGIEEDVERTLKVDAPQTGASAGTATEFIAMAAADPGQVEVRRASPPPGPPPAAQPSAPAPPAARAAAKAPRKAPARAAAKPSSPGAKAAKAAKPAPKAAKAAGKAPAKPAKKPASAGKAPRAGQSR